VPIIFYCPKCGREIRVRSASAGRKGRCVECHTAVVVPDFDAPDTRRGPAGGSATEIPIIQGGFVEAGTIKQS
jgi:hypothetical protein